VNADPADLAVAPARPPHLRESAAVPADADVAADTAVSAGVAGPAAGEPGGSLGWRWIGRWWLVTRALTVFLLVPETFEVFGDIRYYLRNVTALLGGAGLDGTLPEYPVPSVGVFLVPRLVAGDHTRPYEWAFVALMLLVDAAFTAALWRAAGRRPAPGVRLWLWFLPALGPLTLCRLDLVPAVLAGGALIAVPRRPVLAGVLAALGAVVKLWPLAMVPALWLHRPEPRGTGWPRGGRWTLLAGFAVVAAGAVLAVLAVAGPARLVSPLTWQSDRGLQLESYLALPLLVADVFSPSHWHSEYTRFYAFEVVGPGVGVMLALASVAMVAAVAGLAMLWLRAARPLWVRPAGTVPPAAVGLLATGTVCLMIITDKSFSPQYLIWLGALLAAMGVAAVDAETTRLNRLLLALAVLTQVVYPGMYGLLVNINPLAVVLVIARDALLVLLAWVALRRFWTLTGRAAG